MFGLESFKKSSLGQRVGEIIQDPQRIGDMVAFSRHGMPAVQAVGEDLLALGREVRQDQVKKAIGRWVREILEQQGWTVWKKRRVSPGNLFSTGMVYRPLAAAGTNPLSAGIPAKRQRQPASYATALGRIFASPAERAAAWREAVKDLPRTKPLSDEAISREMIYSGRG
jgi:hypothetical protein